MERLTVLTEEMKRAVANRYLKWGILIDDAVINNDEAHLILKKGWEIRFIQGENYLEFYAMNNITGDTHFKVYANGDVEELEAVSESFTYDVSIPGDQDAKRKIYAEKNKIIYDTLKALGLYK